MPAGTDDPVLVAPPLRILGQVLKDPLVIGVENVGAVFVDEDTRLIQAVVGVAAHVVPALQDKDIFTAPAGQLPSHHRPGKAGADDQRIIVFHRLLLQKCVVRPPCIFAEGAA